MNNLITDVKSLEIETLKNLKNSKANNTLRAYQSDFRDFSIFFGPYLLSMQFAVPPITYILFKKGKKKGAKR